MSELLSAVKGFGAAFVITAEGGPFTGMEALSAKVWPGGDLAVAATPAATWLDPGDGTITLAITSAATGALDVGRYSVLVAKADASAVLFEGFIEIEGAPGSAAEPSTYGTFQDMLDVAPWI